MGMPRCCMRHGKLLLFELKISLTVVEGPTLFPFLSFSCPGQGSGLCISLVLYPALPIMEFFQFPDLPCFPHFHRCCPLSPKKNYLEPSAPLFSVGLQTNHTCLFPFSAGVLMMRGLLRKRGEGTVSMPPGEARQRRPQNDDEVLPHSLQLFLYLLHPTFSAAITWLVLEVSPGRYQNIPSSIACISCPYIPKARSIIIHLL